METTLGKILYVGARTHLDPIQHINASEYVFIDIQPRSESEGGEYFDARLYRRNFYSELITKAKRFGFKLCNTTVLNPNYFESLMWHESVKIDGDYSNSNPTLLTFKKIKTGQTLKYYISTNIQFNMCHMLHYDISTSTGLIISGYHPNGELFNHIMSPIELFCYTGTIYKSDSEYIYDPNNIIQWCHNNSSNVPRYFSKIYMVNRKDGSIFNCDDFQHMLNLTDLSLKNKYKN